MTATEHAFSADGPLARAIPGYKVRQQQIEMAQAVAEVIEARGVLIAEAGTGTGKTFAYLVPALLSGGKVIVSTGTKTLQDQLFNRDIPTVRQALRAPVTVALLKGRANYVCHYHLERNLQDGRFVEPCRRRLPAARRALRQDQQDRRPQRAAEVPEDAGVWPLVTSTRDNCLGGECPRYKECFVMEARKQALAADVVVVNHHLFFADLVLRDEGVAELLPACNTVIFDEAHQLPGYRQPVLRREPVHRTAAGAGARHARWRRRLPPRTSRRCRRRRRRWTVQRAICVWPQARTAGGRPRGRRNRAASSDSGWMRWRRSSRRSASCSSFRPSAARGWRTAGQRCADLADRLSRWREADAQAQSKRSVRWVEVFQARVQLNSTPLSIADVFQRQIDRRGARLDLYLGDACR